MSALRQRRAVRPLLTVALAFAAAFSPAPAQGAEDGYGVDLSREGDFVAQTNLVQCVGASMQMMLNIIHPENDRTAATQLRLQRTARQLSPPRPDGSIRQGASVTGWSAGLNQLGAGPYRLDGSTELQTVLRHAAEAMQETRRPVGLLMWRGRHAWVMAGFRATADPARTASFRVTHVVVLDPLYPYGSSVWGRSPQPRELLSVSQLNEQFRQRETGHLSSLWLPGYEGMYVTVLPYGAIPAEAAGSAETDVAGNAPAVEIWSRGAPRRAFAL
jgi:hypothetical protein